MSLWDSGGLSVNLILLTCVYFKLIKLNNLIMIMFVFFLLQSNNLSASKPTKDHLYKILVIGDLGAGKTSIIKRYVHDFFSQHYRATIGVDFALKVLHWDANTVIRLQLWDIAGKTWLFPIKKTKFIKLQRFSNKITKICMQPIIHYLVMLLQVNSKYHFKNCFILCFKDKNDMETWQECTTKKQWVPLLFLM